jgi:hypothetical protein
MAPKGDRLQPKRMVAYALVALAWLPLLMLLFVLSGPALRSLFSSRQTCRGGNLRFW